MGDIGQDASIVTAVHDLLTKIGQAVWGIMGAADATVPAPQRVR